jgi:hypothetical protein
LLVVHNEDVHGNYFTPHRRFFRHSVRPQGASAGDLLADCVPIRNTLRFY